MQLHRHLLKDLDPEDLELIYATEGSALSIPALTGPGIKIHLYGQHYVVASINSLSGRLELKAIGEVSTSREARLRNAADKVDKDKKSIGETLIRVRASVRSLPNHLTKISFTNYFLARPSLTRSTLELPTWVFKLFVDSRSDPTILRNSDLGLVKSSSSNSILPCLCIILSSPCLRMDLDLLWRLSGRERMCYRLGWR